MENLGLLFVGDSRQVKRFIRFKNRIEIPIEQFLVHLKPFLKMFHVKHSIYAGSSFYYIKIRVIIHRKPRLVPKTTSHRAVL